MANRTASHVQRAEVSTVPQSPRPTTELAIARAVRWDELVRRLVAYARRLGASSEEAEDLVQDSVELAVRDPAWLDGERGSPVTALATVLRNRLFDRYRHLAVQTRAAPKLRLIAPDETPPDETLAAADARARRRALLALLEPAERQVFGAWLRQRRGEADGAGAAASVGMTPPAYEAAKKRLRRRCRALLDELGVGPDDLFDPTGGGER